MKIKIDTKEIQERSKKLLEKARKTGKETMDELCDHGNKVVSDLVKAGEELIQPLSENQTINRARHEAEETVSKVCDEVTKTVQKITEVAAPHVEPLIEKVRKPLTEITDKIPIKVPHINLFGKKEPEAESTPKEPVVVAEKPAEPETPPAPEPVVETSPIPEPVLEQPIAEPVKTEAAPAPEPVPEKAEAEEAPASTPEPFEGYAELNVHKIIEMLDSLTHEQLQATFEFEVKTKNRKSLLKEIERTLRKRSTPQLFE